MTLTPAVARTLLYADYAPSEIFPNGRQMFWVTKRSGDTLDYSIDLTAFLADAVDSITAAPQPTTIATLASPWVSPNDSNVIESDGQTPDVAGDNTILANDPNPLVALWTSQTSPGVLTAMLSGGTPGNSYLVTIRQSTAENRLIVLPVTILIDPSSPLTSPLPPNSQTPQENVSNDPTTIGGQPVDVAPSES